MPRVALDQLPPHARLWIFPASRPLEGNEEAILLERVDGFLDEWHAHGTPLYAARDWKNKQFLFVAVDESAAGASGCSIDSMVRSLREVERSLGVPIVDSPPVWYLENGHATGVSREEFAERAGSGTVTLDTRVFDNTLGTVGDIREGRWEVTAGEAWHRAAFFE